ncbi:hypothetical protein NE237_025258 [Protea cynaroides]|uniref:Uncharacterized protein n=1 Tax=Protea cynaroides TaxID=273540 RepID=A0A9Q0H1K5_9MAGN|nr:hypothetical protein NE237_025258 [Protea cynaroides]
MKKKKKKKVVEGSSRESALVVGELLTEELLTMVFSAGKSSSIRGLQIGPGIGLGEGEDTLPEYRGLRYGATVQDPFNEFDQGLTASSTAQVVQGSSKRWQNPPLLECEGRFANTDDGKQVAKPSRLNQVLPTGKRMSKLSFVADLRPSFFYQSSQQGLSLYGWCLR